jgi:hypothetical protein
MTRKNDSQSEAESKEKHGVWDPRLDLTITSPYVDSYTSTMDMVNQARVYLNPMPVSTLCPQSGTEDLASGLEVGGLGGGGEGGGGRILPPYPFTYTFYSVSVGDRA